MMNITAGTTITHKPIPSSFTKKGFNYNLLKREGNRAIYQQTRSGSTINNYEVVKIGKHNGYTMGGVYIEPSETYPGSSLWGIMGWTYTNLEDAQKRYSSIV
jgi:hypothetical protein